MAEPKRRVSPVAVLVALGALLGLTYFLRFVLLPFLIAAAMAYIAAPLVRWLRRRWYWPRLAAVLAAFFLYLLLAAGLGYWLATGIAGQATRLAEDAAEMIRDFMTRALGGPEVEVMGRTIRAQQLADAMVRSVVTWIGSPANAAETALLVTEAIMGIFLIFVLLFYFLLHGRRLVDGAVWLVPPPHRPKVRALMRRIDPMLGRYIRGVFVIVLITAMLSWIAFKLVLGLPHAAGLALVTGVLETVPVVGPLTAAILVGLVAVEQGRAWVVAGFVIFYIAIRLLIDEVIGPVILGKAATLHPVVVIFSFLVGGTLFGLLGVFLAVPFASSVRIVLTAFYEQQEPFGEQAQSLADR